MTDAKTKDLLGGLLSEDTVQALDDEKWRQIQCAFMLDIQNRLSSLEEKMGWRSLFVSVPWAVLGGVMALVITGKI
jgi:hypothetical protein